MVAARSITLAPDRRQAIDQRDQLRAVVPVAVGQQHCQRDAVALGDQVVLGARPETLDADRIDRLGVHRQDRLGGALTNTGLWLGLHG